MLDIIRVCILKAIFRTPAKNTLTGDTFEQRAREQRCKSGSCITVGSYYGMPQATCARCGHRNKCAGNFVKEWSLPD
jgi:uncharacterized OB-fold protein